MPPCLCLCPFSLDKPHAQAQLQWGRPLRRSRGKGGNIRRTTTHYLVPSDPTVVPAALSPSQAKEPGWELLGFKLCPPPASVPLFPEAAVVRYSGTGLGSHPDLGLKFSLFSSCALLVQIKTTKRAPLKDIWENPLPNFVSSFPSLFQERRGWVGSNLCLSLGQTMHIRVKSCFILTTAGRETAMFTLCYWCQSGGSKRLCPLRSLQDEKVCLERIPAFPGRCCELCPTQCEVGPRDAQLVALGPRGQWQGGEGASL